MSTLEKGNNILPLINVFTVEPEKQQTLGVLPKAGPHMQAAAALAI